MYIAEIHDRTSTFSSYTGRMRAVLLPVVLHLPGSVEEYQDRLNRQAQYGAYLVLHMRSHWAHYGVICLASGPFLDDGEACAHALGAGLCG